MLDRFCFCCCLILLCWFSFFFQQQAKRLGDDYLCTDLFGVEWHIKTLTQINCNMWMQEVCDVLGIKRAADNHRRLDAVLAQQIHISAAPICWRWHASETADQSPWTLWWPSPCLGCQLLLLQWLAIWRYHCQLLTTLIMRLLNTESSIL